MEEINSITAKSLLKAKNLPGMNLIKYGKVRDIYDFGETLLIIASDRVSAIDVVMDDPLPDKGRVLT
jgi:phosphoribosylaminoimidazole-succinocarboxamide synthase